MNVKKLKKVKKINLKEHDVEGELLIDAIAPNQSLICVEDTDEVILSSTEYIIVDVNKLNELLSQKIITAKDLGYILIMSKTLKTELNATYNHTIPHTLETLSKLLDLAYANTSRLITKLCRKNIVHRYITADDTYYCINPYLSRRRKMISKELLKAFSTFKK